MYNICFRLVGENLKTMFGHDKRVFPLCAWEFVACYNLPAILIIGVNEHLPGSHVNHRLNGEHHAGNEQHALSSVTVVCNLGFFVELESYAVATKVAYHSVMMFLRVLLYGMADVADKAIRLCRCFCANLQTLFCDTHELFFFWRCLAHDEHSRCIGVVAVKYCGEVYVYDVALLQHVFFLWNAVTNHLIDACTHALGEALVAETCRCRTVCYTIVVANLVYLKRIHADVDALCNLIEHSCVYDAASSDSLNLFRRLDKTT